MRSQGYRRTQMAWCDNVTKEVDGRSQKTLQRQRFKNVYSCIDNYKILNTTIVVKYVESALYFCSTHLLFYVPLIVPFALSSKYYLSRSPSFWHWPRRYFIQGRPPGATSRGNWQNVASMVPLPGASPQGNSSGDQVKRSFTDMDKAALLGKEWEMGYAASFRLFLNKLVLNYSSL